MVGRRSHKILSTDEPKLWIHILGEHNRRSLAHGPPGCVRVPRLHRQQALRRTFPRSCCSSFGICTSELGRREPAACCHRSRVRFTLHFHCSEMTFCCATVSTLSQNN